MSVFRFKRFHVSNERSAMKVNTDGVLLGTAMALSDGIPAPLSGALHLLDIGTGTGTVALIAAQRLSDAGVSDFTIDAIDIDGPSSQEAALNFGQSPWSGHLYSVHSALAGFEPEAPYDHIFSNPPYYDNSLPNPDGRIAAARHTDSLPLESILEFAARRLTTDGLLSLILPAECRTSLLRTAAGYGLHPVRVLSIRTTPAKPVRRIIVEMGRRSAQCAEETLTIQDSGGYTPQYRTLTEEFYL